MNSLDIVFSEIAAGLHFDEFEIDLVWVRSGVVPRMFCDGPDNYLKIHKKIGFVLQILLSLATKDCIFVSF